MASRGKIEMACLFHSRLRITAEPRKELLMSSRRIAAALLATTVALSALTSTADARPRRVVTYGAYPAFDCGSAPRTWAFDGRFGPNTVDAVKAYQRDHGLTPDGVVGPETAWALRTTYRVVMKCGMAGPDILELQKALHRAGYWYGNQGTGAPAPQATPRPATPRPTPVPTPHGRPTMPPSPVMTPEPIETPEPAPTTERPEDVLPPDLPPDPEDAAAPTPEPVVPSALEPVRPPVENMPWVEFRANTWMIPLSGSWLVTNAGAPGFNSDLSLMRQNLNAEAALWFGIAGLSANIQRFDLSGGTFSLGPAGQAGALMYDGDLNFRFVDGFYRLSAGYRGVQPTGLHYATLGARLERPLAGDWLWWNLGAKGGSNLGGAWFYDAGLGLGLRFGFLGFDLGVRQLGLNDGTATTTLNGPQAGVSFKF